VLVICACILFPSLWFFHVRLLFFLVFYPIAVWRNS